MGGAVGIASPALGDRIADVDRLLAAEGGARRLALRRRPPAGLRFVAQYLDDDEDRRALVEAYARRWNLPLLPLRCGPLGALVTRPGETGLPLLSLFVGPRQPADLCAAMAAASADPARRAAAETLIARLRRHRLGLANHVPPPPAETAPARPVVLVVDEPAPAAAMAAMLATARAEHPDAEIRILPLPGLDGQPRPGPLSRLAAAEGLRVERLDRPSAWILAGARRVFVHAHMLGLEALIQGVPVTCFGFPPYAGWGLTDDRDALPAGAPPPADLPALVAALAAFCRCASPYDGAPADLDLLARHGIAVLARDRETAGETVMTGLKLWKRANLRPFLDSRAGRLGFAATPEAGLRLLRRRGGGRLAVWAAREEPGTAALAAAAGIPLLRVEDGFLRSAGLGSNHVTAASLVLDRRGIYYDPERPSDLEHLLETHDFDPDTLAEAERLIRVLVARGLTKYNVGQGGSGIVRAPAGRLRLLVPGQVEDDASIRRGAPDMGGNLGLLQAARAACPEAWIVYKPHPDVEAGNRKGLIPRDTARRLADQVIDDASVAALFPEVDAIHTMTSLVGFEGLLRGLAVTTYGLPFYAGWGLTEDRRSCPRRHRRLSLPALVAGSLLLYPRYVDPVSSLPCDVWTVVERLSGAGTAAAKLGGGQAARGLHLIGALARSLLGR
ncbi:capsular biosynthesis protein [Zavarzinia compransoris]|uniref:Capsular biosynthesis protein n=1 Tax=Zavarzinia compransoris TaxID=1264899 RepID=A0A317DXJ0_9PROT|nr:capsular biosynthesis protein [Zavarzinia compransoris]